MFSPRFRPVPWLTTVAIIAAASAGFGAAISPLETERVYLSGRGPADAVQWEFQVTGGRQAGQWTRIPVPSNWELQGFGTYNYGMEPRKKSDEHGLYRLHFKIPAGWQQRRVRLVFEGVMTDTAVKINGQAAGPIHQGGFIRFSFDITRLIQSGADNLLEVDAAKVSADPDLEQSERFGDYWVYGGIYRPVYLESAPLESIQQVSIDARADGSLLAEVGLNSVRNAGRIEGQVLAPDGSPAGAPFSTAIPVGGTAQVALSTRVTAPRLWTAETPLLYRLKVTLIEADHPVHVTSERFGFRTLEVRSGQGLFLNGHRIMLKGVDRHSFRPETGRALTTENCYEDVRLIKEMNMNAVRMSHYPPDVAFLEACDELGLYVLDELTAWHHPLDTAAGRILVREMVTRDVNHPSILFWDNGNEGGFNRELDGDFALFDPSHRLVLHPWEAFNGIDTKHYPSYAQIEQRLKGPNLYFPTEMLHGIYDGGAGTGLEDFWKLMSASPLSGGGFIWVFADEGLVRTDQGGRVDVFSTFAPDGILGPHHEKEGSFYTVKQIYSPIQVDKPVLDERFERKLTVRNRYSFIGLEQCRLEWKWVKFPGPEDKENANTILAEGSMTGPAVGPGQAGAIALPLEQGWRNADALSMTARGPSGEELWTWVWTLGGARPPGAVAGVGASSRPSSTASVPGGHAPPTLASTAGLITMSAAGITVSCDALTGLLRDIHQGKQIFPLTNGPRLTWARPAATGDIAWLPTEGSSPGLIRLTVPHLANLIEVGVPKGPAWVGFNLEISPDGQKWKTLFAGSRRPSDSNLYEFTPQTVAAIRISHLRRNDDLPAIIQHFAVGYEAARFPPAARGGAQVTTGSGQDSTTGEPTVWLENRGGELGLFRWTLLADGSLRLDYRYALTGEFAFHGITFDLPETQMRSLRWLGQGPYRVWQNRLLGTWFGVHQIAYNNIQAGETWDYPEFQGYFAGIRWATLTTAAGTMTISDPDATRYLRLGTPLLNLPKTSPAFPPGDFSILHAIPAMGTKSQSAVLLGPSGQWARATGEYGGSTTFHFGSVLP